MIVSSIGVVSVFLEILFCSIPEERLAKLELPKLPKFIRIFSISRNFDSLCAYVRNISKCSLCIWLDGVHE